MSDFTAHGPFGGIKWGGVWSIQPGRNLFNDHDYKTNVWIRQTGYGKLQVHWGSPTGSWDVLALVRSSWGRPITKDDGVLLYEREGDDVVTHAGVDSQYTDALLPGGDIFYYSVFVRTTDDVPRWVRAGSAASVVVKDYGTTDLMYNALPWWYLVGDEDEQHLRKFLSLFAFELDSTRSDLHTIAAANDLKNNHASLLPTVAEQLALPFEEALGEHRMRVLLSQSSLLRKLKGTAPGVEAYAEALTGYEATAVQGANLLHRPNDSSFISGAGLWSDPADGAYTTWGSSDIDPAIPTSRSADGTGVLVCEANPGMFGHPYGLVVNYIAGSLDLGVLDLTPADARGYAIPVEPGEDYTVSAYVRSADPTGKEFAVLLQWFDRLGHSLPITLDPSPAHHVTASSTWQRVWATEAAPASAMFMRPVIYGNEAFDEGEVHYLDEIQVEVGTSPSTWEPARKIFLYLSPTRVNLEANPNFEHPTTPMIGWVGNPGTTLAVIDTDFYQGTQCLEVTAGTPDPNDPVVAFANAAIPAEPGLPYSGSAMVKELDIGGSMYMGFFFFDGATQLISGELSHPRVGVQGKWVKVSLSGVISPPETASAYLAIGYIDGEGLDGHKFLVDCVLFEQAFECGEYFDGATPSTRDEYAWSGTEFHSASQYYADRLVRDKVLDRTIDDWLPGATPYELVYWTEPPA